MMLQIVNHGGHCCGIKHIFGFTRSPEDKAPALPLTVVSHGASAEMKPGLRFTPGPYKYEPAGERLDRLLEYLDLKKSNTVYGPKYGHLLEAVLTYSQKLNWHEFLEKRGFKLVTPDGFYNSNTTTQLFVYHRITPLPIAPEKEKEEKKKPVKKAAPIRNQVPSSRSMRCDDPECELCNRGR